MRRGEASSIGVLSFSGSDGYCAATIKGGAEEGVATEGTDDAANGALGDATAGDGAGAAARAAWTSAAKAVGLARGLGLSRLGLLFSASSAATATSILLRNRLHSASAACGGPWPHGELSAQGAAEDDCWSATCTAIATTCFSRSLGFSLGGELFPALSSRTTSTASRSTEPHIDGCQEYFEAALFCFEPR